MLLLCWRDTAHPQGGGSERYLEAVGHYLASHGHDVWYRTARYPGSLPLEHRTNTFTFSRGGGNYSVYPRALAALAAARLGLPLGGLAGLGRPDIIVDTQNGIPFFTPLIAATFSPAVPTVLLTHHCHREQWPVAGRLIGRLGWMIEKSISPRLYRTNRYITVSAPSAKELVDLGVDANRISIVRNGVDKAPDGIRRTPTARHPRLITVSRLVPHKQIEHAIDVAAALKDTYPTIQLDIVGSGWWEDELRRYAAACHMDSHITFYGHVDEHLKHQLLADADIHLMPSRKEGWGISVIEAAEHAVPTIGYRQSTGLQDSIDDGRTGLLVDTLPGMIHATRTLLDNTALYQQLSHAALEKSTHFSWENTGREFEKVLLDVVAEAGHHPTPQP